MSQRSCSVDGCPRPHLARGWCSTHYRRWWVHGDVENDGSRDCSGTPYHVIHVRLSAERGAASTHPCVVCGAPAAHWSWQHTGPSRSATVSGRTIEWGTDLDTYAPMCRRHHAILDGPGSLDAYACGHPRDHRRDCRICRSERQRQARALKAQVGK